MGYVKGWEAVQQYQNLIHFFGRHGRIVHNLVGEIHDHNYVGK